MRDPDILVSSDSLPTIFHSLFNNLTPAHITRYARRVNQKRGDHMTLEEIVKAFGGVSQTARALGITRQTIYHWRRKGDVPEARRIQAEVILARRSD